MNVGVFAFDQSRHSPPPSIPSLASLAPSNYRSFLHRAASDNSLSCLPPNTAGRRISGIPALQFHMTTRRRASLQATTPVESPATQNGSRSAESSPLSSPLTSLGASPGASSDEAVFVRPPTKRRLSDDVRSAEGNQDTAARPEKRIKVGSPSAVEETNEQDPSKDDFKAKKVQPRVFYAADAKTQDGLEDQPPPSSSSSPRKPPRGGGRGRGRGRGRGGRVPNGGGRGRGNSREPGDREDSREPKRRHLTEEERGIIATIKARQLELKRFYHVVGTQQTDILDLLATRDIAKLVKKPKAHTKVPEYEQVLTDLHSAVEAESDLFRKRYAMDVAYAHKWFEIEKERIENSFKVCSPPMRRLFY